MIAWLIAAMLFEAATVSSGSADTKIFRAGSQASTWSQLLGGRRSRQGAASAVLTADGEVATAEEVITPECAEACDDYQQGVSKDSDVVCIDAYRTCAPRGCGMGQCLQRFMDECVDLCSEWNDATVDSMNVCQDRKEAYKCSGEKTCRQGTYRCKQKRIEPCVLYCEGWGFSGEERVDQNTDLVCQNFDDQSENMGLCLPLPCSVHHHNSANYHKSDICRQVYPLCQNACAMGSEEPNSTTTCFDKFTEKCENHEKCPPNLERCVPAKMHQNLSRIDRDTHGWHNLMEMERYPKEVPKWSANMTHAEWRAEQQRAKIATLRRKRKDQVGKLMRRDTISADATVQAA